MYCDLNSSYYLIPCTTIMHVSFHMSFLLLIPLLVQILSDRSADSQVSGQKFYFTLSPAGIFSLLRAALSVVLAMFILLCLTLFCLPGLRICCFLILIGGSHLGSLYSLVITKLLTITVNLEIPIFKQRSDRFRFSQTHVSICSYLHDDNDRFKTDVD